MLHYRTYFLCKLLNIRTKARVCRCDKMDVPQVPVRRALITRGFRGWPSSWVIFPKILCVVLACRGRRQKFNSSRASVLRRTRVCVVTEGSVAPRCDISAFRFAARLCAKMASFVVPCVSTFPQNVNRTRVMHICPAATGD